MIAVVLERCAGVDVHRDTVVVCWMWGAANQEAHWETQKFGTTVGQLLQMKQWLVERGCQDVVVESTGVYWEPVFNVLSEEREEIKRLERVSAPRELSQEERQRQQEMAEMAVRAIRVTLANPQEVKNR